MNQLQHGRCARQGPSRREVCPCMHAADRVLRACELQAKARSFWQSWRHGCSTWCGGWAWVCCRQWAWAPGCIPACSFCSPTCSRSALPCRPASDRPSIQACCMQAARRFQIAAGGADRVRGLMFHWFHFDGCVQFCRRHTCSSPC